ncbi:MAG: AMP-binding protein [Halioglobus sp.]
MSTNQDLTANLLSPLEAFYEREKQQSAQVAFVQPYPDGSVREFSWQEVGDQCRRMAAYLRSLDLEAGSRIALMSNNCVHWIIADIAIWMAGHISVPLYPILASTTITQILDHSGAKTMFVGKLAGWDEMRVGVPDDIHRITFPLSPDNTRGENIDWDEIMTRFAPITDSPIRPLDDVGTIIYTSGTTGMPKGVMHSFRTMATVGTLTGELYATSEVDRMLSYLPLAHVAERVAVEINQLYHGFKVYFSNSLDTFADDLRRARPTLFFAVPRIWTKLQQRVLEQVPEKKLERLLSLPIISGITRRKLTRALGMDCVKIGISGAAPLSTSLMAWYGRLNIEILEGYAMSENFAYSHSTQLGKSKIGYVGTANPQIECKISEQGEVLVKSPTNMLGYYKEPEMTAEAIDAEGFMHTGDRGEIDDQGRLKITGRLKEIFKTSKGKYVAPAPIEDLLSRNTSLEQVCVTGANLPQPIVLVTLSELAARQLDQESKKSELTAVLVQLIAETNARLDKHENLASMIVFSSAWTVESNLITPTLKIKRAIVDKQFERHYESWCSSPGEIVFISS